MKSLSFDQLEGSCACPRDRRVAMTTRTPERVAGRVTGPRDQLTQRVQQLFHKVHVVVVPEHGDAPFGVGLNCPIFGARVGRIVNVWPSRLIVWILTSSVQAPSVRTLALAALSFSAASTLRRRPLNPGSDLRCLGGPRLHRAPRQASLRAVARETALGDRLGAVGAAREAAGPI